MALMITSVLAEAAVSELLGGFFPVTVDLDPLGAEDQRWIHIERPHHLDFLAGRGVRVTTSASLRWTALGIGVPARVNEIQLLIVPAIAHDERGPKLVFRPSVERADIKRLPAFLDDAVARRINAALAAEGDLLGWHFGESLGIRVPLPSNLSPVDGVQLGAGEMSIEIQDRAIVLGLEVRIDFSRRRPRHPSAPA
jgi:hypothetical protein